MLYYVQDSRSYVGNSMLWWRPDGAGYTTDIDDAGLYTAEAVERMRPSDIGWPETFIRRIASREVYADRVRGVEGVETVHGSVR